MYPSPSQPHFLAQAKGPSSDNSDQVSALFTKFADLLDRRLSNTASKITGDIKADLQHMGSRKEAIEQKLNHTVARSNQNSDCIQDLQNQLESSLLKVDDLENRSRRYNFRIRGIPESIKNVPDAVRSFMKELITDIQAQRLELDRAHRALKPPRADSDC